MTAASSLHICKFVFSLEEHSKTLMKLLNFKHYVNFLINNCFMLLLTSYVWSFTSNCAESTPILSQ